MEHTAAMIFWEIRKTAEGKWKTNWINWSWTPNLRDHTTCLYEPITSNRSARTIHLRLPESFISLYFSNIRQANPDNHYFTFDKNIGNYVFVRNWALVSLSEYFSFVVWSLESQRSKIWKVLGLRTFLFQKICMESNSSASYYVTEASGTLPNTAWGF